MILDQQHILTTLLWTNHITSDFFFWDQISTHILQQLAFVSFHFTLLSFITSQFRLALNIKFYFYFVIYQIEREKEIPRERERERFSHSLNQKRNRFRRLQGGFSASPATTRPAPATLGRLRHLLGWVSSKILDFQFKFRCSFGYIV